MTSYQPTTAYQPPTAYQQPTSDDPSMKEKATEAVDQGRQAAGQVAQSAGQHVQQVTQEAAQQARDLVGEAREHARRQAGDQHRALVDNLRSLSSELSSMVERSEQSGTATQLVSQARERVDGVAGWLDQRQPGDLVEELRTFARRRPGTFLLGALAAGVVAGRLTRGAVAAHTDDTPSASAQPSAQHSAEIPPLPATAPTTELTPEFGTTVTTPGYSMGGHYAEPSNGQVPGAEHGYGATSTYGDGGTSEYPSGDFSNGTPR